MAQTRLGILIDAKNQASADINRVDRDVENLGRTSGQAVTGLQSLGRAIAALGLLDLARRAIVAAPAISEMAARIRFTRQAAVELAGSTEELNRLLATYQRVTGGVATEGEALIEVSRLQAIGFANTTKELENFLSAARASSFATGRQLPEVISELQLAIANQSTQRFDQLGISVDSVRSRIDELQSSSSGMSREAAFQQAVLDELNQKYGGLLESGAAAVTGMQDLQQSVRQASEEMATSLGPNIDRVAGKLANLVDWLSEGNSGNQEYEQSLLRAAMATATSTEQAKEYASQLDALTNAKQTVAMQTGEYEQQAWAAAQATDAAGDAAASAGPQIANAGLQAQIASEQFNMMMNAAQNARRQLQGIAAGAVDDMGAEGAIEWAENQNAELSRMKQHWRDQGFTQEEIVNVLQPAYLRSAREAVSELDKQAETTRKIADTVPQISEEFRNLKSTVEGVLSGALDPGVGVDPMDILPRPDAVNENARRLADIVANGLGSQDWIGEFKSEVPDIFDTIASAGNPQQAAARILRDFQDGLRPELIDADRAKEIVKRMIRGEENMAQLAQEVAQELAAEMGIPLQEALAKSQQALGVGDGGSGLGDATANAITSNDEGGQVVDAFVASMQKSYERIRQAGMDAGDKWGAGFMETVGESVPPQLIGLLTTLVTPEVMAQIQQTGSLTGAEAD